MRPKTQYARHGDIHIAYQVHGDGPIDIVLSLGMISQIEHLMDEPRMRSFLEQFTSFARLTVFDRRGIGLSERTDRPATLEEQVDDVRAVMDTVGIEKAAIFGHTMGGLYALLFAASEPERVSHLILMAAFARTTWAPDYTWARTTEERAVFMEEIASSWGEGVQAAQVAPSLAGDQAFIEWYGALERLSMSPGMMKRYMQVIGEVDVRSILPTISTPTMVLNPVLSPFIDVRHSEYLAQHIPGAKYVEVESMDVLPIQSTDRSFVVDEIEEFITGTRGSGRADRILTTVLFTDIVDSTRRAAELGDGAWRDVLDRHDQVVRGAIGRYRGREVNTTGDGFFATFDGPERAVRCAFEIRDRARDAGIDLRAGLHTGEVEVRGEDLGGMAVHIGARVASLAPAGGVFVSRTVKDLVVGSNLAFEDVGEHELKGVPGSWQLFAAR